VVSNRNVGVEAGIAAQRHGPVPGGCAFRFHRPGWSESERSAAIGPSACPSSGGFGSVRRRAKPSRYSPFDVGGPRVWVAGVLLGDDQVEVAGLQGKQAPLRLHLCDVDPQVRVPITQEVERDGNPGQGGCLERGDAQGPVRFTNEVVMSLPNASQVAGNRVRSHW
jgi:hypothetical protein